MGDSKFEGTQEEWNALVQKERLSKMNFKHYKRKGLSEMVSVTEFTENGGDLLKVSISSPDHLLQTHNPDEFNLGYVARNPKNHADMWYVAKKYFDDNLEEAEPKTAKEETFLDRLLSEARDLATKLNALNDFMRTQNFINLDRQNKDLLYKQSRLMNEYLQILGQRIEILGEKFSFKEN